MAKKRGTSGICKVIGVDKPVGMSSHDVVNVVRRLYNERRVGHTGTLDPLASGVLTVCIGPATRLDAYLVDHDKSYAMGVSFGRSTTTDDTEGETIATAEIPTILYDEKYARQVVSSLVGKSIQIPPAFSAIKVNGKKAYEQARAGKGVALEARPIEIYSATLDGIVSSVEPDGTNICRWDMTLRVSKGTYLRAIARDLGSKLGTAAHCCSLRRLSVGDLGVDECISLEELAEHPDDALIDPLRLLGLRWAFAREFESALINGSPVAGDRVSLNQRIQGDMYSAECCTSSVYPSHNPVIDGELVGFVVGHELKAIYQYDEHRHRYLARCVFSQGVNRGTGI